MTELTQLESRPVEVIGLAQASQDTTRRVIRLVDDEVAVRGRHFERTRAAAQKLAAQDDASAPE